MAWGCLVSYSLQAGYQPFCLLISLCSSLNSGPSYDILNLADVANVFNSMSLCVASDLKVLI
jgi:hypothetical protein